MSVAYFGVLEGRFGWSLGKRALRLRVACLTTHEPPGIRRAFLRAAVFCLLPQLVGTVAGIYECIEHPEHVTISSEGAIFSQETELTRTERVLANAAGIWYVLASVCLLATMRRSNGFRGLHEFASDTRTFSVRWPRFRRRRSLDIGAFDAPLEQPAGLPDKVGPYAVRGACRFTAEDKLLLGQDPRLGRAVWIWVRPASAPTLDENHRAVNRTTRVRWLASGVHEGEPWDAFLAPLGCSLPVLVGRNGRLSWPEFRPILEQLTEELSESCSDSSLPRSLSVEQVWLSSKGQLQLLETSYAADHTPRTSLDATSAPHRAMALLAESSALALEGKPGGSPSRTIAAPIPLHARSLLDGFLLEEKPLLEFQSDLKAIEQRPVEVTTWARANQLLAHGTLALFCVLPIAGMLRDLHDHGRADWHVVLALGIAAAVLLAPAYVVRGGWSFSRIAIVQPDGRPASRLRCLARALTAWGAFALVWLSAWVGDSYLTFIPWRVWTIPLMAVALLGGYVYLMLRSPSRAPHDHLVGTYLVPK
jgi:hypothetical protein